MSLTTPTIPTEQITCRLCDTKVVDALFCSPECEAEIATLIEFQRVLLHLAHRLSDCACAVCIEFHVRQDQGLR